MTFDAIDAGWWPYLFILLVGWLPNDVWRFVGVVAGGRIDPDGEWLKLVRAVANALVAAVIARFIFEPSGALAEVPVWLRVGAFAVGVAVYVATGFRLLAGIVVGEMILLGGWYWF